jgi:hypothetical protein
MGGLVCKFKSPSPSVAQLLFFNLHPNRTKPHGTSAVWSVRPDSVEERARTLDRTRVPVRETRGVGVGCAKAKIVGVSHRMPYKQIK